MNIIMSFFCFLSVQTVSFCGHIARYASLSANILPLKQIQNYKNISPIIAAQPISLIGFMCSAFTEINVRANIATEMPNLYGDWDGELKLSSLHSIRVAAASSPTTAGRKPLKMFCTNGDFTCARNILHIRSMSTKDGSTRANVAVRLPAMPIAMLPVALCTAV